MALPTAQHTEPLTSVSEAINLYAAGELEVARDLLESLVEREPLNIDAWVVLGSSYWRLSQLDKAQETLERALAIQPTNVTALRVLGMVMYGKVKLERAKELLDRCVELAPEQAQVWLSLGLIEQRLENLERARECFSKALDLDPNYAEAMNNLGTIYLSKREFAPARDLFLRAIRQKPQLTEAYRSLFKVLREIGSDYEALIILKRGLRINPKDSNAWNDLGGLYRDLSDTPRSIAAYRTAIENDPKNIDAKGNLSCILANDGDYKGAKDLCSQILSESPDMFGVRFRRAITIPAIMDSLEGIEESRATLHRELDELMNYSGTIDDPLGQVGATNFYLPYHGYNDIELQKKQADLFLKFTPSLHFEAPHIGKKRRPGKIRLGVCSRHLSFHTIGILWNELFAGLSRDKFEITLFHTQPVAHRISRNLLDRVDHEIRLPIELKQSQKLIAGQELDILYYPDIGMEPLTYFLAFSRMAPKQVITWGHPITSGIPNIDYFVSSKELEIEDSSSHYSERLVKLDTLNTFYLRPEEKTGVTRESMGVREQSTLYMCPQTLFKFHPDFDKVIAGVLEGDPNGELVLLEGTCAHHTTLIRERFNRTLSHVMDRVRIIPRLSHDGFLALVKMADVMLDPIHFGGGSTTIQALSYGTPVVTLPSEFLRCRISLACYRHMGVDACTAKDLEDYCRIAVDLGRDKDKRHALRSELAEKSGVLFSNPKVIEECEAFLEGIFDKDEGR